MSRGWRRLSVAPSTPSRRAVRGLKLSITTSLATRSASSTPAASGARRFSVTLRLFRLSASKWAPTPFTSGGMRRAWSPPAGSSILTTSAPRSARSSVAYAPGNRRVRSRTRRPSSGSGTGVRVTTEPAVTITVHEVQPETDDQPPAEPPPRRVPQSPHDEEAGGRRQETDDPGKRHSERPRTFRLLVAQHEDADAHEDEGEERPDVGQVVGLAGVAHERPRCHEDAREQRRRPRDVRARMDPGRPRWQQPVARHREKNARLAVLKHEQN